MNVPKDVRVIGLGDDSLTEAVTPAFSAIRLSAPARM
ncbi:MAG: hypothetical protein ACTHZX_01195 [Microbacterium sp.]